MSSYICSCFSGFNSCFQQNTVRSIGSLLTDEKIETWANRVENEWIRCAKRASYQENRKKSLKEEVQKNYLPKKNIHFSIAKKITDQAFKQLENKTRKIWISAFNIYPQNQKNPNKKNLKECQTVMANIACKMLVDARLIPGPSFKKKAEVFLNKKKEELAIFKKKAQISLSRSGSFLEKLAL